MTGHYCTWPKVPLMCPCWPRFRAKYSNIGSEHHDWIMGHKERVTHQMKYDSSLIPLTIQRWWTCLARPSSMRTVTPSKRTDHTQCSCGGNKIRGTSVENTMSATDCLNIILYIITWYQSSEMEMQVSCKTMLHVTWLVQCTIALDWFLEYNTEFQLTF